MEKPITLKAINKKNFRNLIKEKDIHFYKNGTLYSLKKNKIIPKSDESKIYEYKVWHIHNIHEKNRAEYYFRNDFTLNNIVYYYKDNCGINQLSGLLDNNTYTEDFDNFFYNLEKKLFVINEKEI